VRKSDAILALLDELGGVWRLLAWARVLPRGLRDRAYGVVIRNRYRWFGRYPQCRVPPATVRDRFLDV
jgi:predicted DCC family thiol-disulfide oxidoreductase YuxK